MERTISSYIYVFFILILIFSTMPSMVNADAASEIESFFNDVSPSNLTIVTGSKILLEDKILFNLVRSNTDVFSGITILPDSKEITHTQGMVYIGGLKTNKYVKDVNLSGARTIKEGPVTFEFVDSSKSLVIHSKKEETILQNEAILKSPLPVPPEAVPYAASFLSILMLYLWNIFGKTVIELINEVLSSFALDFRTKKAKRPDTHLITLKEIISVAASILVFSAAMSWTWSREPSSIFLTCLLVVGMITLVRETVRFTLCYMWKIRSEYHFWSFGSLITLISTFFGNTFSLTSYTIHEETDAKKFSFLIWLISVFTLLGALVAYVLNTFMPNITYQLVYVYATMIVFIELFPFKPFPGNEMFLTMRIRYILTYIIAFGMFIMMNFTLFVQ